MHIAFSLAPHSGRLNRYFFAQFLVRVWLFRRRRSACDSPWLDKRWTSAGYRFSYKRLWMQIPFFMIKQSNDMISLIDGHDQRL